MNRNNTSSSLYYKNLIDSVKGLRDELEYISKRTPDNATGTIMCKDLDNAGKARIRMKTPEGILVSGIMEGDKLTDAEVIGVHQSATQLQKDQLQGLANGRIALNSFPSTKEAVQNKLISCFSREYDRIERKLNKENKPNSTIDVLNRINMKKLLPVV